MAPRSATPRQRLSTTSPNIRSVFTRVPCAQVDELLAAEPGNAEYLDVKESLTEVIALTEDLLASTTAAAAGPAAEDAGAAGVGGADAAAVAAATAAALLTAQTVSGAACQALYDGQGGGGRRGKDGGGKDDRHTHPAQAHTSHKYFFVIFFFSRELEWGARSRWHEKKRMYAFLISKESARF